MTKVLGFTITIQGLDRSVTNAEELRKAIQEVNKAIRGTNDADEYRKLEKQLIDLKARQAEVNRELADQVRLRRAELTQTTRQEGAYRALANQLNAARARYKDLAAAQAENTQEAKDLLKQVEILDSRLKEIDGSVGQFQRNVGNYQSALGGLGATLGTLTEGYESFKKASTSTGKALAAGFLASAVIQGLVEGARALGDFAEEFRVLRGEISTTTRASGDELDKATAQSLAIANTYKENAQEVAVAANAVSKAFDISLSEALKKTELGYRTGADAQGDFLDQLREYPTQFKAAGASADEFFQILILAQQEGIYSDKGVDVVKEFGLRIREQTKATRDALELAFGKDFTDQLFAGINSGSITTVDALKRVSKQLNDVDLTAEQTQKVLADVFGGPGEDAGLKFIKLLQDVDGNLESVTDSTNEYQTQQQELYEANLALAEAQQRVAVQISNTSTEVGLLTTKVKTFLTNQAATFLEFFDQLPATLSGVGAALKTAGRNFLGLFSPGQAAQGGNIFEAYNTAFKKSLKKVREDNEVAREAEALGEKIAGETLTGLRKRQRELQEQLSGAIIGSAQFKAIQKELDAVNKKLNVTSTSTAKVKQEAQPAAGSIAYLEAQVKKLNEQLDKTPTSAANFAKIGQALAKAEQDLEKAQEARLKAQIEGARKREVARLLLATDLQKQLAQNLGAVFGGAGSVAPQDNEVQQVASLEQAKTDAIIQKVKERNQKLAQEEREARAKRKAEQEQEAREILEQSINEIGDTVFGGLFDLLAIAQQKAAEETQKAFDAQIKKQQEALEFTEAQAERATGIYKRQLQAQAEAQKKAIKEQEERKEKAAKEAAKKEKALAVIQSVISTAISVARALAGPPPFPASIPLAIAAGAAGAAQTAIIAAQPLASGGRVNQMSNAPATPAGDSVLAYLKPGEVVLNSRQQAALGGAPTFRAIRVPGFATGGQVDAPISAPRLPASVGFTSNQDYLALLKGLDAKTDAINSRVDRLRAVVVSEEIARDLEDGETIRVRATLQ